MSASSMWTEEAHNKKNYQPEIQHQGPEEDK